MVGDLFLSYNAPHAFTFTKFIEIKNTNVDKRPSERTRERANERMSQKPWDMARFIPDFKSAHIACTYCNRFLRYNSVNDTFILYYTENTQCYTADIHALQNLCSIRLKVNEGGLKEDSRHKKLYIQRHIPNECYVLYVHIYPNVNVCVYTCAHSVVEQRW